MRWRAPALVALASLLFTSCRVDVQLLVAAEEDGSGLVRATFVIDEEALDALGGDLEDRLRVSDLLQVGWTVTTTPEEGGGAAVVAEKAFVDPDDLTVVIRELSGETGPLRDVRLTRSRSRFRTSFDFSGLVDLTAGVAGSSLDPDDEGLVQSLADEGVDVDTLSSFLGARIDEAFSFEIVAALPGDGDDNAPHSVGGEPAWRPEVGDEVVLQASSSRLDTIRVALLAAAALFGVLALGVVSDWGRRRRRPTEG